MFRKNQKHAEKQMIDIINSRNNINKCGECGADYPTWASVNLGILLCGRCANCHRKVLSRNGPDGRPVSVVKSLTLENWSESQLEHMRRVGNRRAKQRWNPKKVPFPHDDDADFLIEEYLRDKYIEGKFRDDNIESSEYGGSDYSSASDYENSQSRRSSRSRPVPRLTHRKLTTYEQTQYRLQAQKIRGFGYSDMDAILESLLLASGDTNTALDILDNDAKVNPSSEETPPSLPKRPSHSAGAGSQYGSATGTITPASTAPSSAGADWWNQPQTTGQLPQTTGQLPQTTGQLPATTGQFTAQPGVSQFQPGQPQIYQYTDPVSGQVSYVDSNGQQYLDPNNPQHQQLLVQQTPQYLQQQATKSDILSLYSQPQQTQQQQIQHQQQNYQQNQTQPFQTQQTGFYGQFQQTGALGHARPQYGQMTGQTQYQGAAGFGHNQTYQPFR